MNTSEHTKKLVNKIERGDISPMASLMAFESEDEFLFECESAIQKHESWIEDNPINNDNYDTHEEKNRMITDLKTTIEKTLDMKINGLEEKHRGSFIPETKEELLTQINIAKKRRASVLGVETDESSILPHKESLSAQQSNGAKR